MIIDTHMHLYDKKFDEIREDVIKESIEAGITKMIACGCDYETSLKCIELAEKYDFIYAAVGIHPSEAHKIDYEDLSWIYELAKHEKVVAIGEIGLDYYWDKTYIDIQKKLFIKQIKIAKELNLPIIVHSRDSINDTYSILKDNRVNGVLHCFSGSLEMAREFVKLGYYLGVGGVLTFNNSKEIKKVVSEISLDKLLTETDAPYLAPVPFRGTINKPAYIPYIINKIAEIKNIDIQYTENKLYQNAHDLFKLN